MSLKGKRSSSPAPAAASAWPSRSRRRGRRQHRHRRQDRRAAPETARHHLHGRRGDRESGRQGAAAAVATSATRTKWPRPSSATVEKFGGLDICVNNASAISLTGTLETDMKRFDLMHQDQRARHLPDLQSLHPASSEGSQSACPDAVAAAGHGAQWFAGHVAYTMAKYGMRMCVLGMAAEFEGRVAVQCALAAHRHRHRGDPLGGRRDEAAACRTPEIMADAAHAIFEKPRKLHRPLPDRRYLPGRGRARLRPVPGRPDPAPDAGLLRARQHAAAQGGVPQSHPLMRIFILLSAAGISGPRWSRPCRCPIAPMRSL